MSRNDHQEQQEQAPPAASALNKTNQRDATSSHLITDAPASASRATKRQIEEEQQQQKIAGMTPGEQRWAHYTEMKKSFVMPNNSMRGEEFTITEEKGADNGDVDEKEAESEFQDEGDISEEFRRKPLARANSYSLGNSSHNLSSSRSDNNNHDISNSSGLNYDHDQTSATTVTVPSSSDITITRGVATKPGAVAATGGSANGGKKGHSGMAESTHYVASTNRRSASRASSAQSQEQGTASYDAAPPSQEQEKVQSRRGGGSGLDRKAQAAGAEPATMPGAVAVSHADGPNIDGKPGKSTATSEGSRSSAKMARMASNEGRVNSTANPRGRKRGATTAAAVAARRKGRGASNNHTVTIGNGGTLSLSSDDDDDASLAGSLVDEGAPVDATTPPVFRSIDFLPSSEDSTTSTSAIFYQSSNVVMDDSLSVVTNVTEHSAATMPIRNMSGMGPSDASVMTTSTMATAHAANRPSTNQCRASATGLSSRNSQVSTDNSQFHGHMIGLTTTTAATAAVTAINVNGNNNNNTMLGSVNNHGSIVSLSSRLSLPITRHSSGVNVQMRMAMDDQGHTMSNDEMRVHWESAGHCVECGIEKTHKKEKYGIFGVLRRMAPQTVDGRVYKGHCLRCHDVHDLRQLLNDPNIPIDLPRQHYPIDSSLRSLQENNADEIIVTPTRKHSPFTALCASIKFQIFCGIMLLVLAGAAVAFGIILSKGPEPWISPPPTAAPSLAPTTTFPTNSPTSFEWNVVTEIRKTDVESFGYSVELSADGSIMAVASPRYEGSKGRVDVFKVKEALGQRQTWHEIGDPIIGATKDDRLGIGMHLSGDGKTVAVGSPGRNSGMVQVFSIDEDKGLILKGQVLLGPMPLCEFGYAVALNIEGSRIFIGAPFYGESLSEIYGLVQVFDFIEAEWVQVANDIVGKDHESLFASALSTDGVGDRVLVGAPLNDEKWEDAGQIYWFQFNDEGEWDEFTSDSWHGCEAGSRLGASLATNFEGVLVVSGSRDSVEEYQDAGVVVVYGLDDEHWDSDLIGFPVSGSHKGALFGYDVDMDYSGELVIASGVNQENHTGSVRVLLIISGIYQMVGGELFGPKLGNQTWYGKGPSVAVAGEQKRVAVGYESIISNGLSLSEVRVYDYFAVTEHEES